MSDKTLRTLRKDEFEFSQKMQAHFPWGEYTVEDLRKFNGSKALELTALWKKMIDEWMTKCLLLPFCTIKLPALIGNFIVKERFAMNISDNAEVKIYGRGSNFDAWFLDVIEEPIGESELNVQRLQKSSVDRPIINELGGSEKAGIFLQQIWLKMRELQAKGETDGWYVAYVEDEVRFPEDEQFAYTNKKGERSVLRAVRFLWHGGGWHLSAYLVSSPREWRGGRRILSGNSFVT